LKPQNCPPILGFAARSGTGKTTLLTRLLPLLKQQGLNVALVKHSHHDFDIDRPGKDSYRLREAGASPVLLTSRHRRAVITEYDSKEEPKLFDEIEALPWDDIDLILVEGFKFESIPKIELYRQELERPLLFPHDSNIIAIASDVPLDSKLPQMDINEPGQILEFIVNQILPQKSELLQS